MFLNLYIKELNKGGGGRQGWGGEGGRGVLFLSKHTEGGGAGRSGEGKEKKTEHKYSTKVLFCFYLEENSQNKAELKPKKQQALIQHD